MGHIASQNDPYCNAIYAILEAETAPLAVPKRPFLGVKKAVSGGWKSCTVGLIGPISLIGSASYGCTLLPREFPSGGLSFQKNGRMSLADVKISYRI